MSYLQLIFIPLDFFRRISRPSLLLWEIPGDSHIFIVRIFHCYRSLHCTSAVEKGISAVTLVDITVLFALFVHAKLEKRLESSGLCGVLKKQATSLNPVNDIAKQTWHSKYISTIAQLKKKPFGNQERTETALESQLSRLARAKISRETRKRIKKWARETFHSLFF